MKALLAFFARPPSWSKLKDQALEEGGLAYLAASTGAWEEASTRWNLAARTWARAAEEAPPEHRPDLHRQAQACFRQEAVAADRSGDRHQWLEDATTEELAS